MSDHGAAGGAIACTVGRRGRVAVAEPFFEPGPMMSLGRRPRVPVADGELVLVAPRGRGGGEVLERLGSPGDIGAVMHALAAETGVAEPWPDAVTDEAGRAAPPETGGRADLRDLLTFTVDPESAKDFDDAISVTHSDGAPVIHVHIADVAAFVPEGSALDHEAEHRATSVYLPGRVDAMLPPALSDGLCSLSPGVDRLAVTVTMGPADSVSFARTVIRSDHRLTYQDADAVLAGGAAAPAELAVALRAASDTAERWRADRLARGALDIPGGDVGFAIERGEVTGAAFEPATPAHVMIEQLMVRANERVAETLVRAHRPALFRVHPPPEADALEALLERLEALEVAVPPVPPLHTGPVTTRYAGELSAALERHRRARGGRGAGLVTLLLRALERARYDPECLGHSGLASAAYCHFTSPIRRYPDLVCHRALLRHLGMLGPAPALDRAELAAHCSAREREAEAVERRATDICLAHLLHRRLYAEGWDLGFDGELVGVIGGGAFVRFGEVFEGLLPPRMLGGGERHELDELGVALVGARSGHRLRLGDPVRVRVRRVDRPAGKVLLELAR